MTDDAGSGSTRDVRSARREFPATDKLAYFNTAAVGLASRALIAAYRSYVDEWTETGTRLRPGRGRGRDARGPRWRH